MKKLTDFRTINQMVDQIGIEKVYPLSIIEGFQKGEIFVDDDKAPTAALIWHYCGFANILGAYNEEFVRETVNMMLNPPDGHSGRMALQTENDGCLEEMILRTPKVAKYERFVFEFTGEKDVIAHTRDIELKQISSDNYELMKGRIIPAFSWESREEFIKNGFGYCLIKDGRMSACAFASGISKDYVDIGAETAEEYRGKGYGKTVVLEMVKEILRRGKIPVWSCDTRNEASMRLGCSVGFNIVGTHPWYIYEK